MEDIWISKERDTTTNLTTSSSDSSQNVVSYREEVVEFALSRPLSLSSCLSVAIPSLDVRNGETANSPWPEKITVNKATATEDLAKDAEESKKQEEGLVMPPTEDLAKKGQDAKKEEEEAVMEDLAKEAEEKEEEVEMPQTLVMIRETKLPPQPTEEELQPALEEGKEENEIPKLQQAPKESIPLTFDLMVPVPSQQIVIQAPEENDSQPLPHTKPSVLQVLPLQELLLPQVPPKEKPGQVRPCSCLLERALQPTSLKQSKLSQPPALKEATLSQPALPREPLAPPVEVPSELQPAQKQASPMKEESAAPVVNTKPEEVQRRQGATVDGTLEVHPIPPGQDEHRLQSSLTTSINSFINSPVGQVFANTIDRALEKSEQWLEYYLPVLGTKADCCEAAEQNCNEVSKECGKDGCFMRINSLSSKVRDRAFKLALDQLKTTQQATNANFSMLDRTLKALEHPESLDLVNVSGQLQNALTEWQKKQEVSLKASTSIVPEHLEQKALELTKTLALQLHSTYKNLLPHLTELPAHLQDKVIRINEGMEEIKSCLISPSLKEKPTCFAVQCRQKLATARETLDELLDFIISSPGRHKSSQLTSSSASKLQPSLETDHQTVGTGAESKGETSMSQQPALPPPWP